MNENKKLHVLITTYGFPKKTEKGNPFVAEQAVALSKRGVKVCFFLFQFISVTEFLRKCLTFTSMNDYRKSEYFKIITSVYINFLPFDNSNSIIAFFQKRLILLSAWLRLRIYILQNGKPDLIHQHYILNSHAFIVEFLSKKFRIPYIITEHSPIQSLEKAGRKIKPFYTVEKILEFVKNARVRIAVSNKFAEIYSHVFYSSFTVIPNFVPDIFRLEKSSEDPRNHEKFIFLNIGNLVKVKRQDRLIKAFSLKFKERKNIYLYIAGEGDRREEIHKLIEEEGLHDQVILLGMVPREKIIPLIDEANAMVVSSDAETFNLSIVEGMFRGLPAVGTKCGGPEEIINDYNGLLSEKTVEDLAGKMLEMYNNYRKFDPVKIRLDAYSRYSEKTIAEKLIAVYTDVLK